MGDTVADREAAVVATVGQMDMLGLEVKTCSYICRIRSDNLWGIVLEIEHGVVQHDHTFNLFQGWLGGDTSAQRKTDLCVAIVILDGTNVSLSSVQLHHIRTRVPM